MTFKGIEMNKNVKLTDLVPHNKGQMIIHNLVINSCCDIQLFSFAQGEEIGVQTSGADIMY